MTSQVDDSRKTLAHAVAELQADIAAERAAFRKQAAASSSIGDGACNGSSSGEAAWVEPQLGVFVLHNKLRPKLAELPESLMHCR
jgi:hypoxanthine phosphoribosyltransferase